MCTKSSITAIHRLKWSYLAHPTTTTHLSWRQATPLQATPLVRAGTTTTSSQYPTSRTQRDSLWRMKRDRCQTVGSDSLTGIQTTTFMYGRVLQMTMAHLIRLVGPPQVDTRANPPRSIWVHPFDDPQWQQQHAQSVGPPPGPPPGHQGASPSIGTDVKRPIDEKGGSSNRPPASPGASTSRAGGSQQKEHRGFIGKLKDGMLGTKEEREAAKARKAQQEAVSDAKMETTVR
jgi:hypothetical protein